MIPSPDISIRRGDTLPYIQQYLKSRDGTTFVIPPDTLVEFILRPYARPGTTLEIAGQVVSASTGLVRAQVDPLQLAASGRYVGYWRLTLATDDVLSFPDGADLWVQVTPE